MKKIPKSTWLWSILLWIAVSALVTCSIWGLFNVLEQGTIFYFILALVVEILLLFTISRVNSARIARALLYKRLKEAKGSRERLFAFKTLYSSFNSRHLKYVKNWRVNFEEVVEGERAPETIREKVFALNLSKPLSREASSLEDEINNDILELDLTTLVVIYEILSGSSQLRAEKRILNGSYPMLFTYYYLDSDFAAKTLEVRIIKSEDIMMKAIRHLDSLHPKKKSFDAFDEFLSEVITNVTSFISDMDTLKTSFKFCPDSLTKDALSKRVGELILED
ncbi:MAG: hypothetical protein PF542_05495 [Nanoarchaeota archaeon]|jgi:hypothetical protein|nr:hypothetical protein [Nanoarchaeota archaeon]